MTFQDLGKALRKEEVFLEGQAGTSSDDPQVLSGPSLLTLLGELFFNEFGLSATYGHTGGSETGLFSLNLGIRNWL